MGRTHSRECVQTRRTSGPSFRLSCSHVVLCSCLFVKRIQCARATPTANLPYGMFLTRLYRHVMETYPHLDNGIYDIVDRACHSISFSSSHHQGTSSHQYDDDDDNDDDDDVETSRASTPSPTTYLNSLGPLNYQNYQMPSASKQTDETLFERRTTLLN
ncbi:hypothetical protein Tco_1376863 [Tanacetum coccineum]